MKIETAPSENTTTSEIRIVVGDGGWVWIGETEEVDNKIIVRNGCCIRQWGTTRGLGQLAAGPRKDTVLDPVPTIVVNAWIATYAVDQAVWEVALATAHEAFPIAQDLVDQLVDGAAKTTVPPSEILDAEA